MKKAVIIILSFIALCALVGAEICCAVAPLVLALKYNFAWLCLYFVGLPLILAFVGLHEALKDALNGGGDDDAEKK